MLMDEIYSSQYSSSTSTCYSSGQASMASPDQNMIIPPPPPKFHNPNNNLYYKDQFYGGVYGLNHQLLSGCSDAASVLDNNNNNNQGSGSSSEEEICSVIRAKIASHPLYPNLLQAYIDCQKVGAPQEIAYLLDEIQRDQSDGVNKKPSTTNSLAAVADPELDEFMETYCEILVKYKSDLSRPFDEATTFLNDIETQLTNLNNATLSISHICDESGGSSESEEKSPQLNQDCELKQKLLLKYSSYISSLKHEFSKKKKKGKLPKEAKKMLLDWWNLHYKWPYPTEGDKISLAECTGLDPKQINNWFINQRKRHWKPSEDMQFAVLDSLCGPFYYE